MNEFKARCPKCGSGGVSLFKDRSVGWSAREGVSVLHCRTCGKQLFAEAADAEVARQYADWQAAPKAAPNPNPTLARTVQVTHRILLQAREEAFTEANTLLTQAESWLRHAKEVCARHQAHGFEVKCALNLIELDVASVRRLHEEIPQQTVRNEVERRLDEIQRKLRDLPRRIETLELKAKEESENRPRLVPTPQPAQTPNQPEPEMRKCAWKDCTANARPDALYCSSECRIKNARWNYAHRHPKPVKMTPAKIMVEPPAAKPVKAPPPKVFPDLEAMNLNDLRKYATHVLKVERASKIPGGKPVLLNICREVLAAS